MNPSALGRRYLSRFCATFDFPGAAIYLREGQRFDSPEPGATSGLALNWVDGEIQVQAVQKDGPAEQAGIRAQDILVRIADRPAEEFDHFELRQLLTSVGGKKLPLTVRRAEREFHLELTLKED
ncbi:MAG TPA: PDZ domain-containing protein [Planctomycetaceae bacterium]|nr:PDZ domain-containing protein [Planctomycetaceae bacterium]